MMCIPGQLRSIVISEIYGIFTHFAPITNIVPPCKKSKTAGGHILILMKCSIIVQHYFLSTTLVMFPVTFSFELFKFCLFKLSA